MLAGGKGYKADDILESVAHMNGGSSVKYIGYTTHNEKLDLFRHAFCFTFPSLYEGFGLPVVEAMRMGVPVITSNISSLPEVAGKAALLIDPSNISSLRSAMARVARDESLRRTLVEKGVLQAKKFEWENVALETLGVYERVGAKKANGKKKGKKKK